MPKKTITLLLCITPISSFAIGGDTIDLSAHPEAILPSFCKVTQKFQHSPDCSGTLIAPGIVVTASHCVETASDRTHLEVQCGFHRKGSKLVASFRSGVQEQEIKTDPRYFSDQSQAIQNDTFLSESALDFAVLKLKKTTTLEPLALPPSLENVQNQYLSNEETECRYAGFGQDTNFHAGDLSVAELPIHAKEGYDLSIQFGQAQALYHYQSFAVGLPFIVDFVRDGVTTGPTNQSLLGDSGGPLFCRKNATAPWVVIGIIAHSLSPTDDFDVVTENGHEHSRLDLNSCIFEMAFAPIFSLDFLKLLQQQ